MIARLGDQQQHPAVVFWPVFEQLDGKSDSIENGGSAITWFDPPQFVTETISISGERHDELRLEIETYEGRLARSIAEKKIDQGREAVDFLELESSHATLLDGDHDGNRLAVEVIIDMKLLEYAVIQQLKVGRA